MHLQNSEFHPMHVFAPYLPADQIDGLAILRPERREHRDELRQAARDQPAHELLRRHALRAHPVHGLPDREERGRAADRWPRGYPAGTAVSRTPSRHNPDAARSPACARAPDRRWRSPRGSTRSCDRG